MHYFGVSEYTQSMIAYMILHVNEKMHTNLMYLHESASFVELSECRRRPTHTKGSYPKRGQAEQLGESHYVMYCFYVYFIISYIL